jgi:hypothetical protein
MTTDEQLAGWISSPEGERLEFKSAQAKTGTMTNSSASCPQSFHPAASVELSTNPAISECAATSVRGRLANHRISPPSIVQGAVGGGLGFCSPVVTGW